MADIDPATLDPASLGARAEQMIKNPASISAEPSQIVEVVEPLFSNLNAAVEIVPVKGGTSCARGSRR